MIESHGKYDKTIIPDNATEIFPLSKNRVFSFLVLIIPVKVQLLITYYTKKTESTITQRLIEWLKCNNL